MSYSRILFESTPFILRIQKSLLSSCDKSELIRFMENFICMIQDENSAGIIIGEKLDSKESGLRVIFTPTPVKSIRHNVHFRQSERDNLFSDVISDQQLWTTPYSTIKSNGACKNSDSRYATIRSFPDTLYAAVNNGEKEKEPEVWALTNNKGNKNKCIGKNFGKSHPPGNLLCESFKILTRDWEEHLQISPLATRSTT